MNSFAFYSRPWARILSLGNTRRYSTATNQPPLTFAFDIDGVLIRGKDALPAARRALKVLEGNNLFGKKIPYILLTNGGGVGEDERCRKLSDQLEVPIHPNQYIQAHTILKNFSHKYSDKSVLVLGGQLNKIWVQKCLHNIGYISMESIDLAISYTLSVGTKCSKGTILSLAACTNSFVNQLPQPVDFSDTPLSAIFVFHDPRNWATDVQIACDVIRSGGFVGGPYIPFNQQQSPVELVFCNPDLIWRSDFNLPRLGQGAFRVAFQAVFRALTGNEYPYMQFGKPSKATYEFAEQVLRTQIELLYGSIKKLPNIYMVGDNPESDIAGANAAKWFSILVNTGVFDSKQGLPTHSPTYFAQDVEEAVTWAVAREYRIAGGKA